MRFAYADPPYLGCALKLYGDATYDDPEAHREMIRRLVRDYDAWAISLHAPSLEDYLLWCRELIGPNAVRVCPWVKPFASFKPGVNPAFAWEPVITFGGRQLGREVPTVVDWVSANITLQRGLAGAKPDKFCLWLFEYMGLTADDEFTDLFLGSGAVTRAWENWKKQMVLGVIQ